MIIEKPIKAEKNYVWWSLNSLDEFLSSTCQFFQLINDHVRSRAANAETKLFKLTNNCTIETPQLGLLGEAVNTVKFRLNWIRDKLILLVMTSTRCVSSSLLTHKSWVSKWSLHDNSELNSWQSNSTRLNYSGNRFLHKYSVCVAHSWRSKRNIAQSE